ncbi:MAG: hypothetical protein V3U57_04745 [Robiginitomaculum sp.]
MNSSFAIDPLLPIWVITALTVLTLIAAGFGQWRGLKSLILRSIAALILCGALLNPQKLLQERTPLPDIALVLVDQTQSMQIGSREHVAKIIADTVRKKIGALENLEIITVPVMSGDDGTHFIQVLINELGKIPADRLSGVIAITDGQVHDMPNSVENILPEGVPFHALIIGEKNARDRRLETLVTPKYGLVGEQAIFEIRIDDPGHEGERAPLEIRQNGNVIARFNAIIGDRISVPLKIEKRGINTVEILTETADGELTPLNNLMVAEISGVRDRLRVLLITGEPHRGGRAWRNLLKSDPSVDLVQFTILTNPGKKTTNARPYELSLIRFPQAELFEEKITEFDLVVFDQFRQRSVSEHGRSVSILNPYYIANIAQYVEDGGALLVATGPAFAGEESLAHSPLMAVLPARPTGEINTGIYKPKLNDKGKRHPITSSFNGTISDTWGPWYRSIMAEIISGDVLMVDGDNNPLLILDKVEKGRVALLMSDQAWLWSKDHKGGGPYREMFKRLAHWLMSEPDLEADRLEAHIENGVMKIDQFSLNDKTEKIKILLPDGQSKTLDLRRVGSGHFSGTFKTENQGAYRVSTGGLGGLSVIAAAGALNPREYKHIVPSADILAPLTKASGGGSFWTNSPATIPNFRKGKSGAKTNAKTANLVGNNRYDVTNSKRTPYGPGWFYFLLMMIALLWAWRTEGK